MVHSGVNHNEKTFKEGSEFINFYLGQVEINKFTFMNIVRNVFKNRCDMFALSMSVLQ